MKQRFVLCCALVATAVASVAQTYSTRVVARDLASPTGIVARGGFGATTLYFTENPTPGLPGSMGGRNGVKALDLLFGTTSVINMGEPDPVNIAIDIMGTIYWTCRSAGVILRRTPMGMPTPILTNLARPSGIAVAPGRIFYTLVPTPGLPGSMGGSNSVNLLVGGTSMTLNMGEPEPVDIAVSENGTTYWTCKSAGVILRRGPSGIVEPFLTGLEQPVGIHVNSKLRRLYFTEVPTPGVPGGMGGRNKVWVVDLTTGVKTLVDEGDPEPTDVTSTSDGTIYWTCTSAGVIVQAKLL